MTQNERKTSKTLNEGQMVKKDSKCGRPRNGGVSEPVNGWDDVYGEFDRGHWSHCQRCEIPCLISAVGSMAAETAGVIVGDSDADKE